MTARGQVPATPSALLDDAHLEQQVQGDEELRDELLRLYLSQLETLAPKLGTPHGSERSEAAHAIKGASLAIGAFALAELCDRLEHHEDAQENEVAQVVRRTRLRIEGILEGEVPLPPDGHSSPPRSAD